MNTPEDRIKINNLAYDEARKTFQHQKDIFNSIRQRATGVATFSVAISAFLGRAALSESDKLTIPLTSFSIWEFLALALQIIILWQCLYLLRSKEFQLTLKPSDIIGQFSYGEKSTNIENAYAHLCHFIEKGCEKNQMSLDAMQKRLNRTLPALLLLTIFWFADLA